MSSFEIISTLLMMTSFQFLSYSGKYLFSTQISPFATSLHTPSPSSILVRTV